MSLALIAAPAAAQDNGVFFAGGSIGEGDGLYAGALTALPGNRLGRGLALRGSVNAGRYSYDRAGTTIDGEYVGGELALVQQYSGAWGWANVSAGVRLADTSLTPADPANERSGTRFDIALGTDGARDFGPWRLGWFGSIGILDQTHQAQLRLSRTLGSGRPTRVGIEGGLVGDPSFSSRSVGAFVSTALGGRWTGDVAGGISDQDGRSAKPYASIGVSRTF